MTRALYAAGWGYVALCGLLVAMPQARQRPAPWNSRYNRLSFPYACETIRWPRTTPTCSR
jgi:hypothetical protein